MSFKVCFISPKSYPLFNPKIEATFGGAEVQMYLLAKAISKNNNWKVSFLVADYGQRGIELRENVKVYSVPFFEEGFWGKSIALLKVFFATKPDFVVQRTLTMYSAFFALLCRLVGRKFVYMVAHDSEVDGSHKIYTSFFGRFIAKANFFLANHVFVQNEYQQKLVDKQAVLLPSSLDLSGGGSSEKGSILWVGRSIDWKQPRLFIDLAKDFPDHNFTMICPPSTANPDLSDEIERLAQEVINVHFVKYVPYHEVGQYFAEAQIFVNTSVQEGFPNTFMQSMKNRTPILSLNVDPNRILQDAGVGIFCDGNFEFLKRQLADMLRDSGRRSEMGDNGFRYVSSKHDIAVNAVEFMRVVTTF